MGGLNFRILIRQRKGELGTYSFIFDIVKGYIVPGEIISNSYENEKFKFNKMKTKLLLVIIFSILNGLSKSANSQSLLWAKGIGGTTIDQGNAVAVDPLGNIYTTGVF